MKQGQNIEGYPKAIPTRGLVKGKTLCSDKIEIPIHLLGTVALLSAVLLLRALLDLEMGIWVVRLLHWIPTRWLFRHQYVKLKGNWDQIWGGDFGRFDKEIDRHGQHFTYQLFRWVYAETRSQGAVFSAFGRIQGDFLIGRWYDNRDDAGPVTLAHSSFA